MGCAIIFNVSISYITKEKAASLTDKIPKAYTWANLASDECKFVLISVDRVLSVYCVLAVVLDGEIINISDEEYGAAVLDFISNK